MTKITKGAVAWDGLMPNLVRAIESWVPIGCQKETEYSDSLAYYLRECAPDAHIEREYRHLGSTIDIYVRWNGFWGTENIYIELKRNLSQKSQLDRLIGQIEGLQPGQHKIIIVLCGDTAPALLNRLVAKYKSHWLSLSIITKTKPSAASV